MNIYIKCSSRPFYLERLLRSIGRNCSGAERIVLLNDGIPARQIARLAGVVGGVEERRSPRFAGGQAADPGHFWADVVAAEGRRYAMVLEEDTWLTAPIDLAQTERVLGENRALMLRMYWHGSEALTAAAQVQFRAELADGNALEFYGSVAAKGWMDLYNYFCVAHGVFRADYYSRTLRGASYWADEISLLRAAVAFINEAVGRGEQFRLCKTRTELLRHCTTTTSRTDAGGAGKVHPIDVGKVNAALTAAWENGELDVMAGYPSDIPEAVVAAALAGRLGAEFLDEWLAWRRSYVAMYQSMGATL